MKTEISKYLEELERLVLTRNFDAYQRVRGILNRLSMINVKDYGNNAYTSEKISQFRTHFKDLHEGKLLGQSRDLNIVWCYGALNALKGFLCFDCQNEKTMG